MEDSYRQPLILEPGNCQEGKYEEKGREKGRKAGERERIYTAEHASSKRDSARKCLQVFVEITW
jgi:hypothetical protein